MENSIINLDNLFNYLDSHYKIIEFIKIRTCNRAEYYILINEIKYNDLMEDLESKFLLKNGLILEKDKNALLHILRLSSGLESMIIGEDQILGQLKDAKNLAIKNKTSGPIFEKVFTKAIHVGQVARKKTNINKGSVSIGSAAVSLAEEKQGDLTGKTVLIIGAGEMGALVAKSIMQKDIKAFVVANRTYDKAIELAKELKGHAIRFTDLTNSLCQADLIISATGAPHPVITYDMLNNSIDPSHVNSLMIIDIANPRDVEDKVKKLGVNIFNIDDLRSIADKNKKLRENEAYEVEKIIENELQLLINSIKRIKVEKLISLIKCNMELIRDVETKKAINMLDTHEFDDVIINNLTSSIVNKIFADIVINIKFAAENEDQQVLDACEYIFKS